MNRRTLLLAAPVLLLTPRPTPAQPAPTPPASSPFTPALDSASSLAPLRTAHVAHNNQFAAARAYNGASLTAPANIKSASKSVMSALVGIAIDKGVLEGPDQPIAPLLARDLPDDPDPRLAKVTIGNLLSMQAGLARTSGPNYGRWIASGNWVRAALAEEFEAEPGGLMLYSTGSTHLLSAILTRKTGRPALALARDWLGPVEGFAIASWDRDPQGIYFGGNQMAMRPSSLLAFGELYRRGGLTADGTRIVSQAWIDESWRVRTQSRFTGDGYGYGWFRRRLGGADVAYAWGYGGQMLYIAPERGLTLAMTSATDSPAGRSGHRDDLHRLAATLIEAAGAG
ncbi:serine hydrolase domain-containing protein [Ancylobacter defluvii]|uniref:6-aminohexanoate-dimer hydrolase n=1 Tax=Ancylobacter defluvii TaxID=1282440 RepID=A0A9W6JW36_9HYPH|nr:serine hydrolase [Ancylobacter defluvii]MBS7587847.1 serine hydrolase [Ancylobacter defluvii]GLK83676.1 6-aminohexanoate-dimer hydrolase [Ancylobacter defluvii]